MACISELAKLTGIPQPSLSRFFNTNTMPQRSTLLKIAKALNLEKVKIEAICESAHGLYDAGVIDALCLPHT